MRWKWLAGLLFSTLMILILPVGVQPVAAETVQQADNTRCQGCFCPGNPCQLCTLPPHSDDPIPENEPETCRAVREAVPPAAFVPGENEYFANLDKSTMVCIRSGGDVIPNRRRAKGYPARMYCKPGVPYR